MARIILDARGLRHTTGRYYRELITRLDRDRDNTYHILLHPEDTATWSHKAANITYQTVRWKHFGFGEQLGLAWTLYRLRGDLVHFLMPQQPLLYFKSSITTVHDLTMMRFAHPKGLVWWYKCKQIVFKVLLYIVAKKSQHIITPTNYVKKELAAYANIPKSKITVTYEAASTTKRTAKKPVKKYANTPFIIFVGNPFPYKNLGTLCDAMPLIQKHHPAVHLLIVGKKKHHHHQLEAYVKDKDYKGIEFMGFVPDEELVWLYEKAICFVTPSLSEGFGLPGLEAMQHKTPVVSSNATCLPEVYGDAALYFDPLNKEQLATQVVSLIDAPKLRSRLISKGSERVSTFSWDRMVDQTIKVYNTAIGRRD